MKNYRRNLVSEQKKHGFSQCLLVLLTKHPLVLSDEENALVDCKWHWHHVAKWLKEETETMQVQLTDIGKFLIEQFVDFLKAKRCTMEKVSSTLASGVRSFLNLMFMIEEAISERKIAKRLNVNQNDYGWVLPSKKCWIGVCYSNWPDIVFFQTTALRVSENVVETIGFGEIEPDADAPSGRIWFHGLDFEKEPGFFDLPTEEQKDRIGKFVDVCLEAATKIDSELDIGERSI